MFSSNEPSDRNALGSHVSVELLGTKSSSLHVPPTCSHTHALVDATAARAPRVDAATNTNNIAIIFICD
jgi:hypothetical protein